MTRARDRSRSRGHGGAGRAAPVLPPASLRGLYDPRELPAGVALASWDNAFGTYPAAVQATAGFRPTPTAAAINSLTAVRFDGSDDRLTVTFPSDLVQPFALVLVCAAVTQDATRFLVDGIDAGKRAGLFVTAANGVSYFAGGSVPAVVDLTARHLVVAVFNGASSALYVDSMTVAVASGSGGAGTLAGVTIGANFAGGQPAALDLGLLGIYDAALDAAARAAVKTAVRAIWDTPA
jgi:hypothetical protein